MITNEGSPQFENAMTHPRGRGSCARAWQYTHRVKMHYFFKILLFYTGAKVSQTECSNDDKEGFTQM